MRGTISSQMFLDYDKLFAAVATLAACVVTRTHSTFGDSFAVAGPGLWNSLPLRLSSVVTKALDAETETKTEAAGFETEANTETVASETEAKTEAVYLKTEAEAQGSWPILLTVLSSIQSRKIKLNHRYMMFTCNAAAVRSLRA